MKLINLSVACALVLSACTVKKSADNTTAGTSGRSDVDFWLTTVDKSSLLQKQDVALNFSDIKNDHTTITIDANQKFQEIDGFGYTLTGGSATLINHLPAAAQDALLKELFSTKGNGIGVNYLRLSVGASDLSAETFTYDEVPAGETDVNLEHFTIEKEMVDLVPVLKKIIAINPKIKLMGSPWTAPTWMKDNKSYRGGSLKPEYYQVYAKYLVKYIEAMKAQGINIETLTIQNEPLHPGNNPSMFMAAADQATFIKQALGPIFQAAKIKTKILIYDHNADKPEYPISILNDPEAKKYVDGSAFHLYGGKIDALTKVHEAHPDKNLYFTEQWVGAPGKFSDNLKWHVSTLIVGATRNWSRTVLEWNLAADQNYRPFTPNGGCTTCLGAITISPEVTRNVAYYVIGHASKFVPTGSVRIASNQDDNISNVAFKTPDGKIVLIAMNNAKDNQTFNISYKGKTVSSTLAPSSAATYVWKF